MRRPCFAHPLRRQCVLRSLQANTKGNMTQFVKHIMAGHPGWASAGHLPQIGLALPGQPEHPARQELPGKFAKQLGSLAGWPHGWATYPGWRGKWRSRFDGCVEGPETCNAQIAVATTRPPCPHPQPPRPLTSSWLVSFCSFADFNVCC